MSFLLVLAVEAGMVTPACASGVREYQYALVSIHKAIGFNNIASA